MVPYKFLKFFFISVKYVIGIFKNILFLYFRQRRSEGESEGEKHQCVVASHAPPTGDLTWPATQAYPLTGN